MVETTWTTDINNEKVLLGSGDDYNSGSQEYVYLFTLGIWLFQWSNLSNTNTFINRPLVYINDLLCELSSYLTWNANKYYGSIYRQEILNLKQYKVFSNIVNDPISYTYLSIGY